ncbi:glycosyltransferase family 2 protein [Novosphingobium sp. MW5]|nr:glycosyltransferase family 2 protein [Novosphingobium sp. MW5]
MRNEKFPEAIPVEPAEVLSESELDRLGMGASEAPSPRTLATRRARLLPYGMLLVCLGISTYLIGVAMVFPRYLLALDAWLKPVSEWLVWYSGIPLVAGTAMILFDLLVLLDHKRGAYEVRYDPPANRRVTVALTAYNDEDSVAPAVRDFLAHPLVSRVIVVSNNSSDRTFERAEAAGALTFNEMQPGYGRCVFRCLSEAARFSDTELVVLCEGDLTFRAYDIDKLLAYAPHADIVNGTRTVEPLRQASTQLTTFMYYGNLFVGKLLEAKHLGRCTITDVGTTYKLCRRDALDRLLPALDPAVNLEFNAHFLDTALAEGHTLVECPVTFHARVGESKGGNVNNLRGLKVGLRMISGMLLGWKRLAQ